MNVAALLAIVAGGGLVLMLVPAVIAVTLRRGTRSRLYVYPARLGFVVLVLAVLGLIGCGVVSLVAGTG